MQVIVGNVCRDSGPTLTWNLRRGQRGGARIRAPAAVWPSRSQGHQPHELGRPEHLGFRRQLREWRNPATPVSGERCPGVGLRDARSKSRRTGICSKHESVRKTSKVNVSGWLERKLQRAAHARVFPGRLANPATNSILTLLRAGESFLCTMVYQIVLMPSS